MEFFEESIESYEKALLLFQNEYSLKKNLANEIEIKNKKKFDAKLNKCVNNIYIFFMIKCKINEY